jgi:RNA polymerase sigma factor (sigma-70 family)
MSTYLEHRAILPHGKAYARALGALLMEHQGLVIQRARQHAKRTTHLLVEDLVQEGMRGLIVACEKFDPDLGVSITTYAVWYISAYITRAIINMEATVRIPCGRKCLGEPDIPVSLLKDNAKHASPEAVPSSASDVRKCLYSLDDQEREVLTLRSFGCSAAQIGRMIGVSRESISRIEKRALASARYWARSKRNE